MMVSTSRSNSSSIDGADCMPILGNQKTKATLTPAKRVTPAWLEFVDSNPMVVIHARGILCWLPAIRVICSRSGKELQLFQAGALLLV
jgi:hypothetical protein